MAPSFVSTTEGPPAAWVIAALFFFASRRKEVKEIVPKMRASVIKRGAGKALTKARDNTTTAAIIIPLGWAKTWLEISRPRLPSSRSEVTRVVTIQAVREIKSDGI